MKTFKSIFTGLFILSMFTTAYSQSQNKLWDVDEVKVKPEEVANFERNLKELSQLARQNNFPYDMQIFSSFGFKYYFFTEIDNMASYDKVLSAVSDFWSKVDSTVLHNYVKSYEYNHEFILRQIGKFTYQPEQQRFPSDEYNYAVWDVHYIKSEKYKEYNELIEELYALLKEIKFDDPISTLQGMLGTASPMYVHVLFGKDANDFMQQNQKMWQSFGEEGGKLYQKVIPLLRDREKIEFWYRKDLSYFKQ
jgi:hypothetical protein